MNKKGEGRLLHTVFEISIYYGFLEEIFHVLSESLEITTVSRFSRNVLEFLKQRKNSLILKILKISDNTNARIIAN